jgi:hypothetical protein
LNRLGSPIRRRRLPIVGSIGEPNTPRDSTSELMGDGFDLASQLLFNRIDDYNNGVINDECPPLTKRQRSTSSCSDPALDAIATDDDGDAQPPKRRRLPAVSCRYPSPVSTVSKVQDGGADQTQYPTAVEAAIQQSDLSGLNLLSKQYSLSGDENISWVFRYAALMRALIREDYPALVWGTVLNQDLEKFSDEELLFVERILDAVNYAQGKKIASHDRPSIDMHLLEVAMRQGDDQKVLRSASAVISHLKQIEWDFREFELFKKLADWYEHRRDISEARDCWLKGYQSVQSMEELPEVIDQKSALSNLIRLEGKLGNQTLVTKYKTALKRIRVEVVSPTEVVWSTNQEQVNGTSKLLKHDSILPQTK